MRSGTTPSWSQANQSPVRQNPVWISSAMNRTPLAVHHSAMAGRKPGAGTMKPPSPWIGSMRTQPTFDRAYLALHLLDGPGGRLDAGHSLGVAERVRHRHPVHLGSEGAEAVSVGHVLGRQGHGQVGPAVVRVIEDDDGVAAGDVTGDLDGVLDGLGARVEQRRALLVVTRGAGVELLAHGDVLLVGTDHEAGVGEFGDLVPDGLDHGRGGVPHADHGDARSEVDQRVAVDVDQDRPLGAIDVEREHRADPGGHGRRAPRARVRSTLDRAVR